MTLCQLATRSFVFLCLFAVSGCYTHLYKRASVGYGEDGWRTVSIESLPRHTKDDTIKVLYLRMAETTVDEKKNLFVVRDFDGKGYDRYLVTTRYSVETNRSYMGKVFKINATFKPIAQKDAKQHQGLKFYDAHKLIEKYKHLKVDPDET